MRILIIGTGAIGGYFGARLLKAGRDVTFLVRARRAAQLQKAGLVVKSPHGDIDWPHPPTVSAEALREPYDLIILSCKAYDLDNAVDSLAPAVGPATMILPLLNGMRHLDALDERFGASHVLGGLCAISSTLDGEGRILHFSNFHTLAFGARGAEKPAVMTAIEGALCNAGFDVRVSQNILQDMWEKWAFIAAAAGITCLMRAASGDIAAAGASDLAVSIVEECASIAAENGFAPSETSVKRGKTMLTAPGSEFVASMLRDVERGAPTEADHILGDLLNRKSAKDPKSLLRIAYAHLLAYAARRAREHVKG